MFFPFSLADGIREEAPQFADVGDPVDFRPDLRGAGIEEQRFSFFSKETGLRTREAESGSGDSE